MPVRLAELQSRFAAIVTGDGGDPAMFAAAPVPIELPSSLAFLLSDFPVEKIRWAIFAGDDRALAELDMIPGTRAIAVWRSGRAVLVDALPSAAAGFVTALMAGATADDALASTVGEHGPDILPVIRNHVFASRFARVRPQN